FSQVCRLSERLFLHCRLTMASSINARPSQINKLSTSIFALRENPEGPFPFTASFPCRRSTRWNHRLVEPRPRCSSSPRLSLCFLKPLQNFPFWSARQYNQSGTVLSPFQSIMEEMKGHCRKNGLPDPTNRRVSGSRTLLAGDIVFRRKLRTSREDWADAIPGE